MAFIHPVRVYETSSSTGIGDIALDGAVFPFRPVSDALSDGDISEFLVSDNVGNWEHFRGTYSSGTNSISRDEVFGSSNGGLIIDWSVGSRSVMIVMGEPYIPLLDVNRNFVWGFGLGGGTGDAQTVTFPRTILGLSHGMAVEWFAIDENTGDVTVDINGLGAVPYLRADLTQFPAGSIGAGSLQSARYDAINNRLVSRGN